MAFSYIDQFVNDYRNEKNTRRLLSFSEKTIDVLRNLIKSQEEYILTLDEHRLLKSLYEQELERIKYLLTDYLKTRLIKLQKNFYIETHLMSEHEKTFYTKLNDKLKEYDIIVTRDHDNDDYECVGFIALTDIGNVIIDNNQINIQAGDFFVAQFKDIESLLLASKVILV